MENKKLVAAGFRPGRRSFREPMTKILVKSRTTGKDSFVVLYITMIEAAKSGFLEDIVK